jgi:hypothetical protein
MISYTTFSDIVDHGLDYLGSNPSEQARRDVVRAALEAYRDLANAFNWSYLYTHSRIITSAAFDGAAEGATIAYDHEGVTYPRQMTITGAMWPDWAADGAIRVGNVSFKVAERKSATVITLDETINPGADIASGTEFTLYRDTYLLPEDYIAQDQALYEQNFGGMSYTHPRDWLYSSRYVFAQGQPYCYTVTGERQYPGRLTLKIYPWPSESKSIDFLYKRRFRPLAVVSESTGKASTTEGSAVLTGVGTAFTPRMVGSVVRISPNGTKLPTSLIMGSNPAVFESVVTAYISATSIQVADVADIAYSSVAYTISDPIDIEQGAMLNAYLRCVEKHIGMSRTLKDKPSAAAQYLSALGEAKSADSRSFTGRTVGSGGRVRMRLRDMPYDINAIN